jgi:hypothetical protein
MSSNIVARLPKPDFQNINDSIILRQLKVLRKRDKLLRREIKILKQRINTAFVQAQSSNGGFASWVQVNCTALAVSFISIVGSGLTVAIVLKYI